MTHNITISLYELAYGAHLYGAMTGFDTALKNARQALQPEADLLKPEHRNATLEFLRAWGCRLAISAHECSSEALRSWAQAHAADLPSPDQSLEMLGTAELSSIARAYESLAKMKASSNARIGPVAAAKTVFLLRRRACPPWDTAIRKYLHCDESADGYQSYLEQVGQLIKVLAAEAHVQTSELPGLVGRPESSAAEVVDEALWVRCARKGQWKPPSAELLSTWLLWQASTPARSR